MKQTFLYLFIFSLLINVFLYINSKKILDAKDQDIKKFQDKAVVLQDSIAKLTLNTNDFSLATDIQAQQEINLEQYQVKQIEIALRDALIKKNDDTPSGNKLVHYPPINGEKSIITSSKVLNHRWIIADFYAGQARGTLLLKYFINEDNSFDFELINSVLYQI